MHDTYLVEGPRKRPRKPGAPCVRSFVTYRASIIERYHSRASYVVEVLCS